MWHAIYSGLVAAILTPIFVGWAANSTRSVQAGRDGWHVMRPGTSVYLMLAGTGGFSLLLFYIYFFVGSARADAEQQMFYCLILASAFMIGTMLIVWSAFWNSAQWRGQTLRVRPLTGADRLFRLEYLEDIEYSSLLSMFILRFRGGEIVKISPYLNGARQFIERIAYPERGELSRRWEN